MAIDILQLPKDKKALCRIIDKHAEREYARLRYRIITWKLAWYYLNGARRFNVFDPRTGALQPHFVDETGNMEFQCQELLSAINRVSGKLAAMDARPRVVSTGTSLDASRQRSVSQIALESAIPEEQLARVQRDYAYMLTCLGSAGITGYVLDHPTIGLTTDIEVIHPSEVYPFPSLSQDWTKVRGIMRERVLPVTFLEEKFGKEKIRANLDDIEYWSVQAGEPLSKNWDPLYNGSYLYTSQPLGATQGAIPDYALTEHVKVARVRELWINGPRDTCARYIVTSGDYLLDDLSFEDEEVYCPVGWGRFYESGSFHGSGLFDVMFPIARQLELNLKSLFNNIRDIDRYGVLVIPSGQWNERTQLRDIGRGLRVLPWEPDPIAEGFRPFAVQPFNSGELPGKVAALSKQMLESVNPLRDLSEEKGRVDSFSGLQFLEETMNQPLTVPTRAMQIAFGTMYRGVMSQLVRALVVSPRALPVGNLTLDLAGAVIDPNDNTVSFSQNPVPDIARQVFTIREVTPRSEAAKKSEAMQLFEAGLSDPEKFTLWALEEGITIATWMREDQYAYEAVVRDILIMYGDGQSSGQVIIAPHISKPQLQLRVLGAFMSSLKMRQASPSVVNAFKAYREALIGWMGMTLPAAVPNPDDAAMLSQAAMMMPPAMNGTMAPQGMLQ